MKAAIYAPIPLHLSAVVGPLGGIFHFCYWLPHDQLQRDASPEPSPYTDGQGDSAMGILQRCNCKRPWVNHIGHSDSCAWDGTKIPMINFPLAYLHLVVLSNTPARCKNIILRDWLGRLWFQKPWPEFHCAEGTSICWHFNFLCREFEMLYLSR